MGTYGSQSTFAMLDVGLRRCARATVAAAEPMSDIWLPGPCMPMGPAPPSDIRARLRAAEPSVCTQAEGQGGRKTIGAMQFPVCRGYDCVNHWNGIWVSRVQASWHACSGPAALTGSAGGRQTLLTCCRVVNHIAGVWSYKSAEHALCLGQRNH